MKMVKMNTGLEMPLDGDLLALVDALYREVALRQELRHTYEDMMREIEHLIRQMPAEELRRYFKESLFLNTVTYENEMLAAYLKRLEEAEDEA